MSRNLSKLFFCSALLAQAGPLLQHAGTRAQPVPNPFAGDAIAARAGAKLFQRECAGCHGAQGQGLRRAPALLDERVAQAPPGALFWILHNGSRDRRMPSFAHLPEAQRWQIITFLQRAMPAKTAGQ